MITLFRERLPDTKSATSRGYSFLKADELGDCDGVLTYDAKGKGKRQSYRVTEFPSQLPGRAFKCVKPNGEGYDVLIADRQRDDTCCCTGFSRFGYCKHVECLRDLIQQGQLPNPLDRGDDQGWSGELAD